MRENSGVWVVLVVAVWSSGCLSDASPSETASTTTTTSQATATTTSTTTSAPTTTTSPAQSTTTSAPTTTTPPPTTTTTTTPPPPPPPPVPPPTLVYVEIRLSGPLGADGNFSITPDRLEVDNNTLLNVTVFNTDPPEGGLDHELVFVGLDATSGTLAPNSTATFDVLVLAAGNYAYQCNAPGGHGAHAAAGEAGTLVVRDV